MRTRDGLYGQCCTYRRWLKQVFYLILCIPTITHAEQETHAGVETVAVLGAGYVGLVTSGVCSNYLGVSVICADTNADRIARLQQGQMPIFEPNLPEVLAHGVQLGKLSFSSDVADACRRAQLIFIAVQTPMAEDGSADTRALDSALATIAQHAQNDALICLKSTVPIGTAARVHGRLGRGMSIVSNPEFLREGCAIEDFVQRNPIVVGCGSESIHQRMLKFYQPLLERGLPLIMTNNITAETIKYAWNSYSAMKITYANQLALLCNAVGSDIFGVIAGMSFSDELLPMRAIKPGPGYGGSCFPKDTSEFVFFARSRGIDLSLIAAVIAANKRQKEQVTQMLYDLCDGSVQGLRIALLGLSFKQNTDDIRESPALVLLERLIADGAQVQAYDPAAMKNTQALFPSATYADSALEALKDADAVVLMTPWEEFRQLDLEHVAQLVRQKRVLDVRNLWDPIRLKELGFSMKNLGAQTGAQAPVFQVFYQGKRLFRDSFSDLGDWS